MQRAVLRVARAKRSQPRQQRVRAAQRNTRKGSGMMRNTALLRGECARNGVKMAKARLPL